MTTMTIDMNSEDKRYCIPMVVGVLSDTGIELGDEILLKFITSNLVKIKNTFPNSPFLLLYKTDGIDRSLLDVVKSELSAKELPVGDGPVNGGPSGEISIAAHSQILLVVHDSTNAGSDGNISDAVELRLKGGLAEASRLSGQSEPGLNAPDVGLMISINPRSYRIESRITPGQPEPEGKRSPEGRGTSKAHNRISSAVSGLINNLMLKLNAEFSRIYDTYIRFPEEKDSNVLNASAFLEIAEKIELYNRDVLKYLSKNGEKDFIQSKKYLLQEESDNESITGNEGLNSILNIYSSADTLSQYHQRRTNRVINLIYLFFFIAVLLYGSIDINYYLVLFYIGLIPAIALLVYKSTVDQVEDRFLDYRALAEGLRVLFFWKYYGIDEKVSDNYLSKYAGLVSWISRAVKNEETRLELAEDGENTGGDEALAIVKKLWIDSQLDYFSRKRVPLFARSQQFGSLVFFSFVLTLAVSLIFGIYIIIAGIDNDFVTARFEVVLGAIAAIGVAAQAYKSKKAYDELERRYSLTQQIYSSAQEKLESGAYTPEQILKFVGKEALIENSDWLWTHRNLPLEVPKG